ncbi:hypothetical protein KO493_00595 [Tamlana agarivorans]|uniref:Uncharacterized protein n=1 Tax=Pseudotamlana agarivorans TaxID=481183 RepID=A0ACC5U4G7_9FLAO|nr:hypothetical protein [Tamlana agarivorans]MBU2949197.1 hypothetical protein [Tamlana agarivorans]
MKKIIALSLTTLCLLASCKDSGKTKSKEEKKTSEKIIQTTNSENQPAENTHKIVVKEKISSGGYVYLNVSEKDETYWMAIPDRNIEIGSTYYYEGGMEMKNFQSKTLNRIFERVIFSEGIREHSNGVKQDKKTPIQKGKTKVVNIEKAPNGIRIADLFENPQAYLNKEVIVKGEVVKVNNGIMQVNFVHLQDGTTGNGQYDITITTNEEFKLGEIVTIKGSVILNKDFGAGYVYDVLIEKAVKIL